MLKFLSVALTIVALISHGYADITATANLHFDSSTSPVGTILFNQREPQGPVRIIGILDGLQNATVHVRSFLTDRFTCVTSTIGSSCSSRSIDEWRIELYSCWSTLQSLQ